MRYKSTGNVINLLMNFVFTEELIMKAKPLLIIDMVTGGGMQVL